MNSSGWLASPWHARMLASMEVAWRRTTAGSDGGRVIEREGVLAALAPAVPERSVFNSVLYRTPQDLAAARDDLAREYAAAGCRSWTVWVPESDRASAEFLSAA